MKLPKVALGLTSQALLSVPHFASLKKGKNFKLTSYFSIASLSVFAIVTVLFGLLYRHKSLETLIDLGTEKNISLAQVISNATWPRYGAFLVEAGRLSEETLQEHPTIDRLDRDLRQQMEGLSVAQIKVFDASGKTVFSTERSQIGRSEDSSGFQEARAGEIITQLDHRHVPRQDALQSIEKSQILSSYIPIRDKEGRVEAVLELYSDVTHLHARLEQTQQQISLVTVVVLGGLHLVLMWLVRRADALVRAQNEDLKRSEQLHKEQAEALKRSQVQLVQNEKMSGLGRMVAGIAHEINNPISFIYGNIDYAKQYVRDLLELVQLYQETYPDPDESVRELQQRIDLDFLLLDLPQCLNAMHNGSRRIRRNRDVPENFLPPRRGRPEGSRSLRGHRHDAITFECPTAKGRNAREKIRFRTAGGMLSRADQPSVCQPSRKRPRRPFGAAAGDGKTY